ncbi:MAG: poly-gamma-glutamate biosynthesis protein [Parcubacteria group bacterium CG11_big_fil_rev_8_21_14_0_20_39_14]|nr:MAG: poly-gamma-glutamate biosynthesis protein [Parcubacteria group bacterium CG11_big_fil_rev_8_21_14_0_20_39_14]PIS35460.1 MAG: poly-gamma-glutamate biosynthesis protein [Parcubacteria group bacterium CG08_land_8_20_14_0_20_38_56]
MLKKFLITFIILICGGVAALIFYPSEKVALFDEPKESQEVSENTQNQNLIETPLPTQAEKIQEGGQNPQNTVTLMFVGDVMLSRQVGKKMEKENNWKWPFLKIADTLKEADILFGNLEGPISDKGKNIGSIYSFRTDPRAIEGLNFAGFDVLSVANNHILDWDREAMEDTLRKLKEAGINYVGGGFNEEEAHSAALKEAGGLKFAFLGYCGVGTEYWEAQKDKSGIAWLKKERLKEDIEKAKALADLVFVSMHFGEEYQTKQNSEQKDFARLAIDAGADLVIGHHPHVLQPIENYKNGYIAYSLGNFVFDQTFSPQTKESVVLKIIVENGKIKVVIPLKAEISNDFQPYIK